MSARPRALFSRELCHDYAPPFTVVRAAGCIGSSPKPSAVASPLVGTVNIPGLKRGHPVQQAGYRSSAVFAMNHQSLSNAGPVAARRSRATTGGPTAANEVRLRQSGLQQSLHHQRRAFSGRRPQEFRQPAVQERDDRAYTVAPVLPSRGEGSFVSVARTLAAAALQ